MNRCGIIDTVIFLLYVLQLGWTPLHWAAYSGHVQEVQMLIRLRADVNVLDKAS